MAGFHARRDAVAVGVDEGVAFVNEKDASGDVLESFGPHSAWKHGAGNCFVCLRRCFRGLRLWL